MIAPDRLILEEKSCEILEFGLMKALSIRGINRNNADIMVTYLDNMADEITTRLKIKMPAEELFELKYEASWWQAFKKKFFPPKLLQYFPIKYKAFKGYLLNPHISANPDANYRYYAVKQIMGNP
jgi:hypothetical protein